MDNIINDLNKDQDEVFNEIAELQPVVILSAMIETVYRQYVQKINKKLSKEIDSIWELKK